jgi:PAS domain S-box-containing protein
MTPATWLELKDRALDAAAEGITMADARKPGRPLMYVNEGFERLTGYSAAESVGINCKFLQGEQTDPATVQQIRDALNGEREVTVEILNYRKDGQPFWNRLSITPVRDESGEVSHFIGVQSDVTARRRAEDALRAAKQELEAANAQMRRDLANAAMVQRAWLPHGLPDAPGLHFAWTFRPCQDLAGDGLNVMRLDQDHIGLYVLDVSGHGVPAALLSAALNRWLSPSPDQSCLFQPLNDGSGRHGVRSPGEVVKTLNRQFPFNPETNQYFTMIYGVLDLSSRNFRYVTAGHPLPLLVNGADVSECPSTRGLPVGIQPDAPVDEKQVSLSRGDRLLLYTDGAFEATDAQQEEFGQERLKLNFTKFYDAPVEESLTHLADMIQNWCPDGKLQDDVTLLSLHVEM